jgi:hypothetical protein
MQHADTLTVVHHDDSETRYRNVRYALDRHGIRIWTAKGEHAFTDVLTTHAYRRRTPAPRRRTKAQVAA